MGRKLRRQEKTMEGQKNIDTTLIMGSIALMDVARKGLERVVTVEGSGARRMKKQALVALERARKKAECLASEKALERTETTT